MNLLSRLSTFWKRPPQQAIIEALLDRVIKERLNDIENSMTALGWNRLGQQFELEFSRSGLTDIWKAARYSFVKNPIINRGVTLQAIYVFGQGVTLKADNETLQAFVDDFISDPKNRTELFSHQARIMKEQDLQVLGNIFFTFHSRQSDGRTIIRTVLPQEVTEIVTNPEDAREPWFYRRIWTQNKLDGSQESFDEYYPASSYDAPERPTAIRGIPVRWERPMLHMKSGGLSDMHFAPPEIYQALDWSMSYVKFLQDWANVVAAHATYAMSLSTGGGKQGQLDAIARLGSTLSQTDGETRPRPAAGSIFVSGQGTNLAPIKTAGATENPEGARRLLLMQCAGLGMPETFFGDVSVGTLATAKSLDRPTELKFRDRQTLWGDTLAEICTTAARIARGAPGSVMRRSDSIGTVTASFPPILEHDVAEQMAAIVSGATLNGNVSASTIDRETLSRLVLQALSVENVDEVVERLQQEWAAADAAEADRQDAMAQAIAQGLNRPAPSPKDRTADPGVKEAIRQLAESIKVLHEKAIAGTYAPTKRQQ